MINRSHEEIAELVSRLQKNDLNAFGELYEIYANKIYRRCNFLLKDDVKAQDAVHDIFIKMLAKINGITEKVTFEAWFNRMVYNHCIDVLRKEQKFNETQFTEENQSCENLAVVLENLKSNETLNEQLRKQLDELNETDRTILSLFYWENYSVKEIAEIMGIGESAIKMRMKRSRDSMKANLGKDVDLYSGLLVLMILQLI